MADRGYDPYVQRERALWLAALGIAVVIMAVGVAMFSSGAWLRDRYEFPAEKCQHGPLVIPDLSGGTMVVDSRRSGAGCNAATQRAQVGSALDFVGPVLALGGAVFGVVVIRRRPGGRAAPARPTGRQSRSLGATLIAVGRGVIVAGAVGLVLLAFGVVSGASPLRSVYRSRPGDTDYDADKTSIDWLYILLYVGLIAMCVLLVWIGRNAARRGRRHLQASADELRATDPRPPVLYLRSFEADDVMAASKGLGNSAEESLVAALNVIGPVVALGEPGEKLPPLGAARAYSTDDRWQLHISDWAAEASQVVLLAGHTDNFWWEVRHLVASGSLGKAVFLLPGGDAYRAFRERFMREVPGIPLPATLPGTGELFTVAGVLRFSGNASRLYPVPPGAMTKARWTAMLVGSPTG
ncbi:MULTISPECIES: hypothetical protein [unclassified Mycobacterium]|uniref:hypothetical protein n=1 Tax=unclassified Mycobacterium TaxID=2642494 RepID=UPI0029C7EC68|nr:MULTISPECIES: hypothetical protein [unclassified Mycobacterium]